MTSNVASDSNDDMLCRYMYVQEEAALATKKLADMMVEVHRSQELAARSSPGKKHPPKHKHTHPTHHKGSSTSRPHEVQDEEEEEDEEEYSYDDFEEDSTLNISRYSQSQSPSKQVCGH